MVHRERGEREVDAELQAHVELHIEDNLRRGMTPTEARRVALARLGGLESVREQCRDARRFVALEDLGKDLRYSARGLAKSRAFTAVAVLSLALGIGVNTAVLSVIDAMLFRLFPYADPDRLVHITRRDLQRPDPNWDRFPRVTEYRSWTQRADVFEAVASSRAGGATSVTVASEGHPAERLRGLPVSTTLIGMLDVEPQLGRGFLPDDGELGSGDVVILSHSLWQRRFGGDATVIGETLWLDRRASTIVGVMPLGFRYGAQDTHLWLPARLTPSDDQTAVEVRARLAPGVTLEQAQVAMDTLAAQRAEAYPETNDGWGVRLAPPLHLRLTRQLRQTLFVLWGAAGFVVLIACANVAGVLLARASARTKEVATRLALGASQWRVVRLFLAEGVLLALAGGALGAGGVAFGLMGAFWLTDLMRTFSVDFEGVSVLYGVSARDLATFAMVSALLVGTVLLACYGPTRVVSQVDPMRALRHE